MGEDKPAVILPFVANKKTIRRQARREVEKMYALTGGGRDPVVSEEGQEAFEQGFLDEPILLEWGAYCQAVLERLG